MYPGNLALLICVFIVVFGWIPLLIFLRWRQRKGKQTLREMRSAAQRWPRREPPWEDDEL